ncbi:MerR family transcriptional regulator [Bacillus sp. B1-b2]|uniref:MerR family transcriptional regulator n=1 Tax=Bacillus sp. B1-b2 TaxID=2653201 RepID=UPI0012622C9B|nr:MerR family transcriptional regulator [Bacillus sp. B1-b2]KAB7673180.1 MerR family transcriptional regulator [Bacillus sp. B1-b2]
MKSYTIREASQKLTISPTRIKQWEKELKGLLIIPRTKNGTRFYTEKEISLLGEVKNLYNEKKNARDVKESLAMLVQPPTINEKEDSISTSTNLVEIVDAATIEKLEQQNGQTMMENNIGVLLASLETYKQNLLEEVKGEIKNGIKKEVVESIVKEINHGKEETIYEINKSLHKAKEEANENIEEITNILTSSTDKTTSEYQEIRTKIQRLSQISKSERKTYSKQWTNTTATSQEIKSMIQHLSKSNEELNKSVEQLSENDRTLLERLRLDKEEMTNEIQQREASFQELVQSFRVAATATEPKKQWWRIWA